MELLGVRLSSISNKDVLNAIEKYLDTSSLHHIVTINPEFVVEAQKNSRFKDILNQADIQLVDGYGLVVALEYLRTRGVEKDSLLVGFLKFFVVYIQLLIAGQKPQNITRLTGVDLIWLLVQQEFMRGRKMYLLGGKKHVSAQAVNRLSEFNEAIHFRSSNGLDNVRDPDMKQEEDILADINAFAPDVLLVAYGHPWQDEWIAAHANELRCRVAVGVGGAFDYISQRVTRAPTWMRSLGLEWLYRLMKDPGRFVRIFRATFVFVKLVISKG